MNKQKLSLNLGLALIIVASLMNAMAIRVNAGEGVVTGSSVDSSSSGGGSFTPVENSDIQISILEAKLVNLNAVAIRIINQVAINEAIGGNGSENIILSDDKTNSTTNDNFGDNISIENLELSPTAVAVAILIAGTDADTAVSKVKNSLEQAGVNARLIEKLTKSMRRMIRYLWAAAPGVPIATKLQPAQLVVNSKSLAKNTLLAQNTQASVDINKLNATINAYNQIIMESDVKTLKKLAANPEFMAIRTILNQFRTALK